MGNLLRGVLFVAVFVMYVYLVYSKGIGEASFTALAILFALNVYFFIPVRVASRTDGDEGNFFELIGWGESKERIDRILLLVGMVILIPTLNVLVLSLSAIAADLIQNSVVVVVVAGVGIAVFIFAIKKVFSYWYDLNMTALNVLEEGSLLDKAGMLISYIGIITCIVADAHVPSAMGIILTALIAIFFFSPIFPKWIINEIKFFSVDLPTEQDINDIGVGLVIGYYILVLAMQVPAVHFTLSVQPDTIRLFSILLSIPGMFVLSTIIISMMVHVKKVNYLMTLGMLGIFYGVLFSQSGLVA